MLSYFLRIKAVFKMSSVCLDAMISDGSTENK